MIVPTKEDIERAYELVAKGVPRARGYRILVKPLEASQGIEAGELEKFETLHAVGLVTKSDERKNREDIGSNVGFVMDIGPHAYSEDRLSGAWCKEGEVIAYARYSGDRMELPTGSGVFYRIMNDEDVFCAFEMPEEDITNE